MQLHIAAACFTLLLQAVSAPSQQPVTKGSIEGTVTRSGSGQPIPGARVTLGITVASPTSIGGLNTVSSAQSNTPLGSNSPSTVTDGQGKFSFRDLYPGAYSLSVGANGYAKQEYGRRTLVGPGTPVNVGSGQAVKNVAIELVPGGSITGRIRDSSGQGAVGMQVQLLQPVYTSNGTKTYLSAGTARSDDRGEYRLYWITPGRYILMAGSSLSGVAAGVGSPNELTGDGIPPTYFPGTVDLAQASILDVKPASEIGGADIFIVRQATYRIRGRVIDGQTGQIPGGVVLSVVTPSVTGSLAYSTSNQSYNAQDGSFEFRDVSPGLHMLRAQPSNSNLVTPGNAGIASTVGGRGMTAQMTLNVQSDMDGIVLTLVSGASLSGRLIFEGATGQSSVSLNTFRVQLRPSIDGSIIANFSGPPPVSQATSTDGALRIDTVFPGEFRLTVTPLPADVYVKQARFNQVDILNKPMQYTASDSGALEVVLSARGGQVDGTAGGDNLQRVQGSTAVLIPDRQRDRIDLYKNATVDANGKFDFRGIAPGDYHVFVWEAIDPYVYFDPDFLKRNESRGTPVHVSESSKETVDVRMISFEP